MLSLFLLIFIFKNQLETFFAPTSNAACLNDVSFTHTIQHRNSNGELCDIGANICDTANKSLLLDFIPFVAPPILLGADATVTGMLCPGYDIFPIMFTDGTAAHIHMYYCPQLSETLILPNILVPGTPTLLLALIYSTMIWTMHMFAFISH